MAEDKNRPRKKLQHQEKLIATCRGGKNAKHGIFCSSAGIRDEQDISNENANHRRLLYVEPPPPKIHSGCFCETLFWRANPGCMRPATMNEVFRWCLDKTCMNEGKWCTNVAGMICSWTKKFSRSFSCHAPSQIGTNLGLLLRYSHSFRTFWVMRHHKCIHVRAWPHNSRSCGTRVSPPCRRSPVVHRHVGEPSAKYAIIEKMLECGLPRLSPHPSTQYAGYPTNLSGPPKV